MANLSLRLLSIVRVFLLVGIIGWSAAGLSYGQAVDPVPVLEEAEDVFRQGLEAFEEGDYGMAYRRFRLVYEAYPLHRKTTAAILMAGKALYRDGAYRQAVELLSEFVRTYATSSYLDEARRTISYAEQKLEEQAEQDSVIRVGVVLPLSYEKAPFTQSLFNGIRLAVDAYNETAERRVQMVFRDSRNDPQQAREAVASLAETVDAVIGPLYSEEAEAAAEAAEQYGVVLVPPLATDETVARGRRYVFQANPSMMVRGRLMARKAVEELGLRRFGVVAELGNSLSERWAEGFQEEALRLGAEVAFFELLPDALAWEQLTDFVDEEQLADVEALYLPIHGRDPDRLVRAVLSDLDGLPVVPRILGNTVWHGLPYRQQASEFGVTYTHDFFVDPTNPAVQAFEEQYRELAGETPGRLAFVGYDVTRFLLQALTLDAPEQPLFQRLHETGPYQGLGTRFDFSTGNVNEALFYLGYRNGEIEPMAWGQWTR